MISALDARIIAMDSLLQQIQEKIELAARKGSLSCFFVTEVRDELILAAKQRLTESGFEVRQVKKSLYIFWSPK